MGQSNVSRRILGSSVRAVPGSNRQDGRVCAQQVEKAERRGVDQAFGTDGGHEGDRTRRDQARQDRISASGKLVFEVQFHFVSMPEQKAQSTTGQAGVGAGRITNRLTICNWSLAPSGQYYGMANQSQPLTDQEHKAMLDICLLAAFADGGQDEVERTQVERIVNGFPGQRLDTASAYQDVVAGKVSLPQLATQLHDLAARALAYEMAVCVCHADGVLRDPERQFLTQLRQVLQLEPAATDTHLQTAHALVAQPLANAAPPVIAAATPASDADLDKLILNASILNGALEIMPHTLATMAIIPLQMRMVYQIGKRYGFELDRGHVKDFLGTVGIGLTSQVFEGFTRKLVGGLARGLAGGLLGGLAGQAVGSAFAFATTYALGQVAKQYYASGRTLTTDQLRSVFSSVLQDARSLQGRYTGDISRKAQQVNVSELLPLVRQG
jgi:uncharacterized protein (DUF697 family)/tellurite resistance protein